MLVGLQAFHYMVYHWGSIPRSASNLGFHGFLHGLIPNIGLSSEVSALPSVEDLVYVPFLIGLSLTTVAVLLTKYVGNLSRRFFDARFFRLLLYTLAFASLTMYSGLLISIINPSFRFKTLFTGYPSVFLEVYLLIPLVSAVLVLMPYGGGRFKDGLAMLADASFLSPLLTLILAYVTIRFLNVQLRYWQYTIVVLLWPVTVVPSCIVMRIYGWRVASAIAALVLTPLVIKVLLILPYMLYRWALPLSPFNLLFDSLFLPFSTAAVPFSFSLYSKGESTLKLAFGAALSWLFIFNVYLWGVGA